MLILIVLIWKDVDGVVLAPIKIFRIYVDKCPENIDEKELYWLEPAGGYASIRMEDITFGMNRVSNRFEQYTELRASIENRMRDGGFEIGRVDSHEVITLVKDIPNGAYGLRRYYNGIFASRVAWIRMKDVDGVVRAAKFLVDDGEFRVAQGKGKTVMEIKGRVFKNLEVL